MGAAATLPGPRGAGGAGLGAALGLAAGVLGLALAQRLGVAPAFMALALAPLAEEVVFRLGLQEALWRCGVVPAAANVLTALAFALAHLPAHPWPWALATALPALALGALYARTRRLWPCVVLHAAMNGAFALLAPWMANTWGR